MASTSPFSPASRLHRRADLVIRRMPEIRICMVYRPSPARIVSLNPSSWLLFEACDRSTVEEIEAACTRLVEPATVEAVRAGLLELLDLALVEMQWDDCRGDRREEYCRERATEAQPKEE